MSSGLLRSKNFLIHYGGKIKGSRYVSGKRKGQLIDGDELNFMDLEKEIVKLYVDEVKDTTYLKICWKGIKHDWHLIRTDQELMSMCDQIKEERDKKFHLYSAYEPPLEIESDDEEEKRIQEEKDRKHREYIDKLLKDMFHTPSREEIEEMAEKYDEPLHVADVISAPIDEDICVAEAVGSELKLVDDHLDVAEAVGSKIKLVDDHLGVAEAVGSEMKVVDDHLGVAHEENIFMSKYGKDLEEAESDTDLCDAREVFVVGDKYGPTVSESHNLDMVSSDSDDEEWEPNEEDGSVEDVSSEEDNDDFVVEEVMQTDNVSCMDEEVLEETRSFMKLSKNLYEEEEEERIKDPDPTVKVYEMSEGMEWRTMNEARKFFKNLAITRKFSYQQVKNDNRRLKLKCKDKDCKWIIHASVLSDKVTVRLRYFSTEHTCQADENNKYAQAKTPWCRTELEDCLRAHPHFKPQDLIDEIFSRYGVELSYWTAWNTKCQLYKIINGSFEDGYKKVAELARQIKMKNEGSVVNWYRDEDTGEFTGLIIAFKASLDGFVSGCRPLIGLDGAHLKGKYGGCVLTAMTLDAQNGLFPLAIFVCNGENKAAWSRMLGVLQQYIWKHPEQVTFMSDRQKGLVDAIKQLYPGKPNRYCFRHMYENFKLAGHKGDELKLLSYGAAKAYREAEYLRIMAILKRDFPEAKKWLGKEELKTWTRHNFDLTCKSDAITNNPCESFNAWILKIRDKPLIQFVDMYILALMGLVYDRRMLSMELDEDGLVPYAEHIIERLSQKYNRYKIQGVAERIYCVINSKNGKKFDVDLSKLTCSCIIWQMTGIPCVHACAVIRPRREGWVRCCSPYYTVKKFRATYAGYIFPLGNEDNWKEVSDAEAVLPPPRVIAPGRPKKMRIKGAEEDIGTRKGNRECSKCKGYGHNATTCDRRKKAAEKLSKGKNVKKRVMEEDAETSTQGQVRGRGGRTGSGGRATRSGRGTKGGRSSRGGRSTQATDSSQDLSQVIQSKPARATRGGKGKRGKHN